MLCVCMCLYYRSTKYITILNQTKNLKRLLEFTHVISLSIGKNFDIFYIMWSPTCDIKKYLLRVCLQFLTQSSKTLAIL